YSEAMFARAEFNEPFRRAMEVEVERAEAYLRGGEPLVKLVAPELRVDVALFIAGGLGILRAIRAAGYDVWHKHPRLSRWQQMGLLARCWWSGGCGSAQRIAT